MGSYGTGRVVGTILLRLERKDGMPGYRYRADQLTKEACPHPRWYGPGPVAPCCPAGTQAPGCVALRARADTPGLSASLLFGTIH